MEIFAKLESWDYLAAAMLLFPHGCCWAVSAVCRRATRSVLMRKSCASVPAVVWLRALCIWPAAICSCNIAGS